MNKNIKYELINNENNNNFSIYRVKIIHSFPLHTKHELIDIHYIVGKDIILDSKSNNFSGDKVLFTYDYAYAMTYYINHSL